MKAITSVFRKEPALLGGLIVAVIAVIVIPLPSGVQAAITGLGAVISSIAVRAIVWAPGSVVEVVTDAASKAATTTAEELTSTTVGVAGELTQDAGEVVTDVVDIVANDVLKGVGFSRKERQGG